MSADHGEVRGLRVTWVLPYFAGKPAGGTRVVYRYANELAARGHSVTVVHAALMEPWQYRRPILTRREGRAVARGVIDLTKRRPLGPAWESVDPRVKLRYVPTISPRSIPEGDVVVATSWRTAESVSRYPSDRGAKAYFIQHLETWDGPAGRVEDTWRLPLDKIVIAGWLAEVGHRLTSDPIIRIPNAIDLDVFTVSVPPADRPLRVAMLSSKAPVKGLSTGLAVLEAARERVPGLEAVLFGVRPRPGAVPDWIEYRQNPPLASLVHEIYNGSAVYLCPSRGEGWHLPPAEAMACGCAVVSTAIDGVADYAIEGRTALTAPVDDVDGLSDALVEVLTNAERRRQLVEAGRAQIAQFSWEKSTDLLESHLSTLAGQAR